MNAGGHVDGRGVAFRLPARAAGRRRSTAVRALRAVACAAAAALLAALAGCHPPPPATSDVYVWQRAWRPALGDALKGAADLAHAWRVLAAEAASDGRLQPVAVDAAMLAAASRPVVMVVRIDGQLAGLDDAALVREVVALHRRWHAQGLASAGVEIDHDCGTARLPGYARFLAALRRALPPGTPLAITALPAWLASADLESLLAQADESVLQLHAVQQPRAGLFDARQAQAWTNAFARRTSRPFRVALPTYGSRVSYGSDGRVADIESEAPTLIAFADRQELAVAPAEVARLLEHLRADPPPHLLGWAWFRLPTADDRRAWRLATWRAVVQEHSLRAPVGVAWRPAGPDLYDIVLENAGALDAELPTEFALPPDCPLADAANGYALAASPTRRSLRASHPGLLQPGSRLVAGWIRCSRPPTPSSFVLDASR